MKRRIRRTWHRKTAALAAAFMAMSFSGITYAMPQDSTIRSGKGDITRPDDKTMRIDQQTDRLAIDWKGFDIQNGEKVQFKQPDARAIALNRVTGDARSVIDGQLTANGRVYVINPNGVLFGRNASVDVGSLVASTAKVSDETMKDFANGKDPLTLALGDNSTAQVINAGTIQAQGGLVALHAAAVENTGTIGSVGGKVALAAAKNITLSEDTAGKLNFTVDGEIAKASTLNSGVLSADGGYLVMTAKQAGDVMSTVVNNTGTLEAKTLRQNEKGEILLDGGDNGQVEVSGTLDASGLENDQSAGNIKVIGQKTIVHDNTNLLARGTIDGGKIETSGDVLNLGDGLTIDAAGVNGKHGEWLLDPLEVIISDNQLTYDDYTTSTGGTLTGDTSGKGTIKNNVIYNDPAGATANAGSTNSSTTWINVNTVKDILAKGTDITIQAISSTGAASITLDSPINVNIDKNASKNPTFTLEATRNITINSQITADSSGKGLNVILNADTDGDAIGAVIINADISTNGGNFISATGGTVTHKSQSNTPSYNKYSGPSINFKTPVEISGAPNHSGSTVGTYFGDANSATAARNRHISTNGGAITLNGEVAIGLNGGTLNLETNGGALTVTGIVNSGNSYDYYYYNADTDTWNKTSDDAVIKKINGYVDKVLNGTEGVPMYEYKGINYFKDKDGNLTWTYDAVYYPDATNGNAPHYVFRPLSTAEADDAGQFITNNTNNNRDKEDTTNFSHTLTTSNPKWYLTKTAGWGFNSFIVTGKSSMTIDAFLTYLKNTYGNKANFNSRYPHGTKYSAFTDAEKENLRKDITSYLAHNWYVAQEMASTGSKGNGDQVGDSYLATITTRLENSLTTPNGAHIMWAGGRGSGVRNRNQKNDANNVVTWYPADPTHPDGFYWVTGPEGLATDNQSNYNDTTIGTGTKFWDTSSTDVQKDPNNYGQSVFGEAHWSTNLVGHQPDDNGPFLTVGYGSDNQWDDANFGGETTVGFVRETNLAHSNLDIQAGSGTVNLQGNIGGSEKLDTVTINTTGNVKTGGSSVTDYNVGTINTDHGIDITGADVTIGGRMTSGSTTNSGNTKATDNITINATGNITVHGITSNGKTDANGNLLNGGKISLTSTKSDGIITLATTTDKEKKGDALGDDGTLTAASGADDAVVIDAQGTSGSFVNQTSKTAAKAITTGTGGSWEIYSASPDRNTFGSNLNSGTDAMWTSKSKQNTVTTNAAGVKLSSYATADENASGKFIFQVQPTITVSAGEHEKTYGTLLTDDDLHAYLTDASYATATFKGADGKDHKVTDYAAFKEKDPSNYIDGTTITLSSDAAPAEATRLDGNKTAPKTETRIDGKDRTVYPVYDLVVNIGNADKKNGYGLQKKDGQITINAKTVTLSGSGEQTYGTSTITKWIDTTTGTLFGAKVSYDTLTGKTPTIKTGSSYDQNWKNYHPNGSTADASDTVYQDALASGNFSNINISDAAGNDMSANYTVTTTGDLKVNKANIILNLNDVETTYGEAFDTNKYGYDHNNIPVLNGDDVSVITDNLQNKDLKYTNTGDGTNGRITQDADNDYKLKADDKSLGNYNIHFNDGKSVIDKAKLSITTPDITTEYGTVTPGSGSSLTGLTNGDENDTTGLVYDYTYGNGYLDHDTRTNDLGDYTVTTGVSGKDYLKNYVITPGTSKLHIDPKDVYVRVYGHGNTTQDITYVDPDIDSKLSYGDHATWTPNLGGKTGEFTYDVITDINGHPFQPGESDVIGNYRFHYDGEAVVSPSKPDIDHPVVPPVVPGNGGYTLPTEPQTPSDQESGTVEKDWGTRDEGPGVDRERHIIKVQLPFFKIDDGKMTNYGTYDVKSQAAKVDISPTGKRLPEPDQPKTQYREYTKAITTSAGTGEFRMIYNGSTFHVMPLDAAARAMMQTGDETHNVDLFAKALHIGFSEMGIIPADLDGVYANFQDIAADAQNSSK